MSVGIQMIYTEQIAFYPYAVSKSTYNNSYTGTSK